MDGESALAKAIAQSVARGELMSGFVSKHIGADRPMQENNFGLGYKTPGGMMVGAYRNSVNKPSVYVGKEFLADLFPHGDNQVQGGLVLGGATGYGRPITPLLLPELVYKMGDRSVAATMVPPVKGVAPATLALQLRKKF